MVASLFEDVVHLYSQSSNITISRHRIENPILGKFCVGLSKFSSMLGESADEGYWLKYLIPQKRLRFGLCAAPFTKEYKYNRISSVIEESKHHLQHCSHLYPDVAAQAFAVLDLLSDVLQENKDPLLDKLVELSDAKQKVAWVIKESRLIPHVEEVAAGFEFPELYVLHPLQLKSLTCYDQLFVIGPSRWFPKNIFTAARSSHINILVYDWIRDSWMPEKSFISPHKSTGQSNRKRILVTEHGTSNRWTSIDAEKLIEIVAKDSSMVSALGSEGQDEYDKVEAVCAFLEGDWAVFIEATEGAKTLVIDPDEDTEDRISRTSVKNIQPGTFILVRTKGGGDYIIPMANKLMGDEAQKVRDHQSYWKELLRNYVRRRELFATCIDLIDLGSEIANEVNVRNWMAPRSIRTQNYNDFLAIMRLINLDEKADEYWEMMGRIVEAHRKAGFRIRKLLLEQVRKLDIEELQKRGKMDFKLSDGDEGGLTAFRVEHVLPQTVQVPYSRIGNPLKLEEQLWRE